MTAPGEEVRRAIAVRDLHSAGTAGVAVRIAGVALVVATATGLLYLVSGRLLFGALADLCTSVGLCG